MEGMWEVCRRCIEGAWKVMGKKNQDFMLIRF